MKAIPKLDLHQACLAQLEEKIQGLQQRIAEAQQSAAEDTKSSAGDKFETSREMMKQEIDKANQQMGIFSKMKVVLEGIEASKVQSEILPGSLVQTNEGWYYFAVSLGKVQVGEQSIYVLSMASPLGQQLKGMKVGEELMFRGRKIQVLAIAWE